MDELDNPYLVPGHLRTTRKPNFGNEKRDDNLRRTVNA